MPKNATTSDETSKAEFLQLYKDLVGEEQIAVFSDADQLEAETKALSIPSRTPHASLVAMSYTCSTEKPTPKAATHSPTALWVGLFDHIPRWKFGSVVNFATFKNGYPSRQQAALAASELRKAADEWNAVEVGVTFKWVPKLDDAAFVLQYNGTDGPTLAEAFFPDEKIYNIMYVYKSAFSAQYLPMMKNIFLHELGHVLGLRHEFAAQEGGAVEFGKANENSVMAHKFPPTIQESDKVDARAFYKYSKPTLGIYSIRDMVPDN